MLLVCDIGNTRIKSALFDKDKMTDFTSFTSVNKLVSSYEKKDISSVSGEISEMNRLIYFI